MPASARAPGRSAPRPGRQEQRRPWGWGPQAPTATEPSPVKLLIRADDNAGMLSAITAAISERSANIRNIDARTAGGQAVIDLQADVSDAQGLERLLQDLKQIPGVNSVERV